jgi:hypothetical protein
MSAAQRAPAKSETTTLDRPQRRNMIRTPRMWTILMRCEDDKRQERAPFT